MQRMRLYIFFWILFAIIGGGCTVITPKNTDVEVIPIFTEAAATIEAQLTSTSEAQENLLPPTSLPTQTPLQMPTLALLTDIPLSPSATLRPVYIPCDLAQFVADVTLDDGTNVDKGEKFVKIWRVRNVGSCPWYANYTLDYFSGLQMSNHLQYRFPSLIIQPGQTIDLTLNMQAPDEDGQFIVYWGIKNPDGKWIPFIGSVSVGGLSTIISVGSGIPKNTDTPGEFRVRKVTLTSLRTGACADASGKYTITAKVSTTRAGTVTYFWKRSDGIKTTPESITFLSASSKDVIHEWVTSLNNQWVDLVIDSPNHQQFGRAVLVCP